MAAEKNPAAGRTSMLLLKLLEEEPMYGYQMIETLRKRSDNIFELKAGTLYPLLHSMEEKGCVSAYEQEVLGKIRKYYRITPRGKKELRLQEEEWRTYADAVERVMKEEAAYGQT